MLVTDRPALLSNSEYHITMIDNKLDKMSPIFLYVHVHVGHII